MKTLYEILILGTLFTIVSAVIYVIICTFSCYYIIKKHLNSKMISECQKLCVFTTVAVVLINQKDLFDYYNSIKKELFGKFYKFYHLYYTYEMIFKDIISKKINVGKNKILFY